MSKFSDSGGLGISLEGTVDVVNGQEIRPHHYIRSILPEGPIGRHTRLRPGDELLEVELLNFIVLSMSLRVKIFHLGFPFTFHSSFRFEF